MRRGVCPEAQQLLTAAASLSGPVTPDLLLAQSGVAAQCETNPGKAADLVTQAIAGLSRLPEREFGIAPAVYRAGLHLNLTLYLAQAGRYAEAIRAANAGLALAASHSDGRYFQVALLRTRSQAHAAASPPDPAAALDDIEEAARVAPGVVNAFEEVRLQTLLAGRLIDAGKPAEAAERARNAVSAARPRAAEIGPSFWMILADAAEVMAKTGHCADSANLYAEVDRLTQGTIPRSWRGNRLFCEAECAALAGKRTLAAQRARQAIDTYGGLLPATSRRRDRLQQLLSWGQP